MVLLDLGKMLPGRSREMQNCLRGDVLFHRRSWNVTSPETIIRTAVSRVRGNVQCATEDVLHFSGLAQDDFS